MKIKLLSSLLLLLGVGLGVYTVAATHNQKAMIERIGTSTAHQQAAKITAEIRPHKVTTAIRNGGETQSLFSDSEQRSEMMSPARISPSGATLYGFLAWDSDFYGEDKHTYEFREIMTDGQSVTSMWDSDLYLSLGFVKDGVLHAYGHDSDAYYVYSTYYGTWDVATGEQLSIEYTDHTNFGNTVICGAYDPDADKFYAYTYNRNGSGYMLRTSSSTKMSAMTTIESKVEYDDICLSMAYCPIDRTLYGVTTGAKFVKVNPADGSVTELFDTRLSIDSNPMAMIYSPEDNTMLWNVNYKSGISAFYSIDIANKKCTKIADWVEEERYSFFACPDQAIEADAPAMPTIKSVNFGAGATQGEIVITMPTITYSGTALSGQLDYFVKVDDKQVAQGSASAGQDVKVALTLEEGFRSIKCYCVANGKKSQETVHDLYVGTDIPKAPTNVKLDQTGLRWDAVTEGVNGGYIESSAMTYEIYVNDEKQGTSKYPIYAYDFPKGKTIDAYTAKVYAVYNGKLSEPGVSNTVIYGDPYTSPAVFTPTERQALLFNMVDANDDGSTWVYDPSMACFYNFYNYYNDADDWLITPAIKLTSTDHIYEISLDAAAVAGNYTEAFEVYIGGSPTPATMTKIFGRNDVSGSAFKTYSDIFTIDATGNYYIGIRATSKAAQYMLRVANIRLAQSERTTGVPGEIYDITTKPASEGGLSATVTFRLPEVDMKGNPLDKSTEISATVCTDTETITKSGKPGARLRVTLNTQQGYNTVKITPENEQGKGKVTEFSVYTGVDVPNYVTGIKSSVSEDNMTIHLTWNPPYFGYNGGYIDPDGLTYRVCYYSEYAGWTVDPTIPPLSKTSFDYQVPKGEPLGAYNIGITAVNEAGRCPAVSSIYVVAGEPYKLPVVETFPGGMSSYNPMMSWTPSEDYNGSSWFVDEPGKYAPNAAYDKGAAIVGFGSSALSKGRLSLAKFSTEGATNPVFTFDYYFRGVDGDILALTYGMTEPVKIGSTADFEGDGWGSISMTLPAEFQDKKWVELYIDATYPIAYTFIIVGQYEIRNMVADDDAVISVTGPSMITIDQTAEFHAKTKVLGTEGSPTGNPAYKWSVYNNGELLDEYVNDFYTDDIATPGTEHEYTYTLQPTTEYIGNVEVVFELLREDMNLANNKASTTIEVKNDNSTIVVTDLRAVDATDSSVSLDWSDLNLNFGDGSFENNTPFEITPTIAPFKNIDGDGAALNYFSNWACPNQALPAAWVVWNATQVNELMASYGVIGEYTAHEGDNFLIAMSPMWDVALGAAPVADDWLISEEVKGGTDVTFYAQPVTNVYGAETIELLASSTTDEVDSFQLVASFKVGDPSKPDDMIEWEECRATLPSDARYFAIRYVSKDIMGIIIDDIRYTSLFNGVTVVGYDVLRDDETIAQSVVNSDYVDNTITDPAMRYRYNVVPVLSNGSRGSKSNNAFVTPLGVEDITDAASIFAIDGGIVVTGHMGDKISIATVDGKVIANQQLQSDRQVILLDPGVYVIKAGNEVAKLIIR